MLYCNHCYASVEVGADNAPTSTTCKFCKQPIENPLELIEYAGLVAQQKHKKIVKLKNILGILLILTLCLPLILHLILFISQRPFEVHDFSTSSMFRSTSYGYGASAGLSRLLYSFYEYGVGMFGVGIFCLALLLYKMIVKVNHIKFKQQILWFATPFIILCTLSIYWESLSNVKYFRLNPWLAELETAIKIAQLLVFCFVILASIKSETVYLSLRGVHFKNNRALSVLLFSLVLIIVLLNIGIEEYSDWYEENVYRPKEQAELSAEVEKWDAYWEEQETTNSN